MTTSFNEDISNDTIDSLDKLNKKKDSFGQLKNPINPDRMGLRKAIIAIHKMSEEEIISQLNRSSEINATEIKGIALIPVIPELSQDFFVKYVDNAGKTKIAIAILKHGRFTIEKGHQQYTLKDAYDLLKNHIKGKVSEKTAWKIWVVWGE